MAFDYDPTSKNVCAPPEMSLPRRISLDQPKVSVAEDCCLGAKTESKLAPIAEQFNGFCILNKELADTITNLEKRIDSILSPEPTTPCGDVKAENAHQSALASGLRTQNAMLNGSIQRLRSLNRRVAL